MPETEKLFDQFELYRFTDLSGKAGFPAKTDSRAEAVEAVAVVRLENR